MPIWQIEHAAPPVPQAPSALPGWQALPWQQPFGQDCASQTHQNTAHLWPATQAGPPPHVQIPPLQPFVLSVVRQFVHAPPPMPQALRSRKWQASFWQHPLGQV